MFLEPTNQKQWNLFNKVDSIGHIETFRATSDVHVGDFVLISVGTQDKNIQSGVYAVGVILSKPYILRDSPEDYCNNKLTVNVVITRFYKDGMCQLMSTRTVYGTIQGENNTISFENNYLTVMQNTDKTFLYERLKKEFNTMKFDVVIGNPPYNKGMDLDFVDLGYKISNKYTVMITPAKWQTTADDYSGCASKNINYKQFRELYVPHMSYVCFYPACKDVFDILQVDGITWYLLDKCNHEQCIMKNKCRYTKAFNSCEKRSIKNRESLFNIENEIVKYLGNYNIFTFPYQYKYKHFQVWTNTQVPGGGLSTQIAVRKTQFVGESHIGEDNGIYIEHSNASICSFSSDSKAECESFISWLNCKFTRFFVAINPTKLTGIITNDNFRFVPAPPTGKFDHIYTDEELYKAFNLPQKYIDIIEAVITVINSHQRTKITY